MLIAAVGDVHGRFFRVEAWIDALEGARGAAVELVLGVGDLETFLTADDHRRKSTKRAMPAEFAAYARGERVMRRELCFVGGNNEDFEALWDLADGGWIAPRVRYLGRAGMQEVHGLRVAYLSGIYAPTRFMRPPMAPTTRERSKQAGYFRATDVETLGEVAAADLLLLHEWPRGIAGRDSAVARCRARGIREHFWPQVGNPFARELIERIRPPWVLCGHLHVPHATSLRWEDGTATRVVCLDEAARSEAGLFWMEWSPGGVREAGWGTSGVASWRAGEGWDERQTAARIRGPASGAA